LAETILYERRARIAYVTLNRPEKLNAITTQLQDELLDQLDDAAADPDVHVAVVRGAGRAFCAGYDLAGGAGSPGTVGDRAWLERVVRGWLRIWDLPIPVIAQVHGQCLAGGTQLAAICDVTIAADDANIGTAQLPLGAGYVAAFWTWLVGAKKAKEIFLRKGTTVTASEAVHMGLFNRVVPAAQLDDEVDRFAGEVARTPKDLLTLEKLAINRAFEAGGSRDALFQGVEIDAIAHTSPSVREVNRFIRDHGLREALRAFKNGELL
jgi:enoyl-CoA hydratase/carnithine racemase